MQKKNFRSNLAAALNKKSHQTVFHYIYFEKGKAVATDAHILVATPLEAHGFTEEEIENLQGYCMSIDQFKRIRSFQNIHVNRKGGISCFSSGGEVTEKLKLFSEIGRYPDWERVIPTTQQREATEWIGLDFDLLSRVKELLVVEGKHKRTKLIFHGSSRGVLIEDGSGAIILVMPCKVTF